MRWWMAALLVAAALPAQAQAQQGGATAPLLEDASGDVTVGLAPDMAVPDGGSRPFLDLLDVSVAEAADSFTFTLHVADLAATQQAYAGDASYYIRMTHADALYQVQVQRRIPLGGTMAYTAFMEEGQEDHFGRILEQVPVVADAAAGTLTVSAPRDRLLDLGGAAPFPGRSLTEVHVVSMTFPVFGDSEETAQARDAMPDEGPGASVAVALGDVQAGDAALFAPDPTRVSNGEATTHAFAVLARNLGAAEALFTLSAEGLPGGWEVTVPMPLLSIPAGGEVNTTMLASTPFAHQHGLYESFRAVLAKQGDPGSRGTATLGVRYTEVPQPAGHHDTLYLHGRSGQTEFALGRATINTLQDDENDDGAPIPGEAACNDGPELRHHFWVAPLDPPLRMGLDFDLARAGTFEATLHAARPMLGTRLSGELVHEELGVLATIAESAPQDLQRDGTLSVSLAVTPTPQADLVPYLKDKSIQLRLATVSAPGQVPPSLCPDALGPSILPGASLQLPLLEYHDPLPVPAASVLVADGPVRRAVAPGSVVVFPLRAGGGPSGRTVALDLFGVHSEWARLVGDTDLRLAAGQEAKLAVEVTVPEGTAASERVDLVVQAVPATAGEQASFLRLVVEVDPAAPAVHEAAAVDEERGSPGLQPLAAALLVLAGALLARRGSAPPAHSA